MLFLVNNVSKTHNFVTTLSLQCNASSTITSMLKQLHTQKTLMDGKKKPWLRRQISCLNL
jgi:hypothetical protein